MGDNITTGKISHEESVHSPDSNGYGSPRGAQGKPASGRGWFFKLCRALVRMCRHLFGKLRKYLSPAFLLILGLSFLLWYSFELQDEYSTQIPIRFNIEGTELRTKVAIHGTGYNIVKQRYSSHREIRLTWKDLDRMFRTSAENPDAVVIQPKALQNIIAERYPDMAIDSMSSVPEVVRLPVEEE